MSKLKIFIAGHKGMVGSALVRILQSQDVEIIIKDRNELDLLNQKDVQSFFKENKIDQVYLAAAKVEEFMRTTLFLLILYMKI